ncbi:MAG TPA: lipocalin-like domain-containing protein [Casimicrobiaceae bacterium]|nr:lipocalin-like domain-containing protein [Casimicrobiaceae bacterium]
MKRRRFLGGMLALAAASARVWADDGYPPVAPGRPLAFPRDHGSHPDYRTEWWYVTGWVRDDAGRDYGVQVTFFRHRPRIAESNPSAFAPRQLLFAHAAIADPVHGRLRHDQRAARAGFGLAEASVQTTRVAIDDWSLELADDVYSARIGARDFELNLSFAAREPPLPNGDAGVSRKGPLPAQASWYYSRPQLAVSGTIALDGTTLGVRGVAWLDHEWSSEYMAAGASGWDWTGINFDDGAALMAFRMRDRAGGVLWAGGTWRGGDGRVRTFAPSDIRFAPRRTWRSPRTDGEYPVAMTVGAGGVDYAVDPLFDDQELDSRASTGTVYWEGAVRATGTDGSKGRGYLELTGYGAPLRW